MEATKNHAGSHRQAVSDRLEQLAMTRQLPTSNSPSMRRILAVLAKESSLDGHQIAERAHCTFTYFENQCRHVLMAEGLIHISAYRNNHHGPFVPVYSLGPLVGDPPKKPKKLDQLARSRDWKFRTGYNEARKAARRLSRPDPGTN